MIKHFFEDLSSNRADLNMTIFGVLLTLLLGVLFSVLKKNKTTLTEKFYEVGNLPVKKVLKYSFIYIVPVIGLLYTIYDNYDKPYNFKTNLSLIIIFASFVVIFLLDFIIPLYNIVIKILDNNRQSLELVDKNNKIFSEEIVKLRNEVDELKKRLE